MIEFLEESHTYLVNGIIVPSVSQILSATIFKDKYANIPKYILNNKAQFGTNVHKAIETGYSEDLTFLEQLAYEQYKRLVRRFEIVPIEQEQLVHYEDLYCGTLDMVAKVNDILVIADIKTTYQLDEEYLSWQLSFYKYAYERTGKTLHKAYCLWIPKKDIGQFVEVPFKTETEVLELVKQYENIQRENQRI